MSLRSLLVVLGVGSAAIVLLLLTVPVALSTWEAASDEAEQEAIGLAQGVADVVTSGGVDAETLASVVERANGRRNDTPVTVVLAGGVGLGAEQNECAAQGSSDEDSRDGSGRGDDAADTDGNDDLAASSQTELVSVEGGRLVRLAVTGTDGEVTVCAFVDDAQVRQDVLGRLGGLGLAALGVLAVVATAAVLIARRTARHLVVATATADRLAGGDLDARVPDAGPAEVRRMGAALNRLAGRIDELLVLERESAADLSHRLRTPLMAVRLDVEALAPSHARAELDAHLDVLERTLTAVIAAARRPQREGVAPGCDALAVTRDRLDYWTPLLEDQGRVTSLVIDVRSGQGDVRCAAEDLAHTLDALLENVASHTPESTPVEVMISSSETGEVRVEVRDQGPGVPKMALLRGRSDRGSSGLGLDIARACAESTGGRLELDRVGEWTVVRLVLGPADPQVGLTST